ncbi:MAG: OmpA family protein [candidate division KSB1 bacterium]|nr:OmpA family protein [candidate division KSB1 bacterium]MDZ7333657.1 OmpA family protein [candidate division KSB1 bacterium]MDZ7356105.1 OmpA family protein [candidate division KSB1 bacterium]MDZ7376602.1 OmpA family protein [candidate division KSB1 bacterium]MDZ7398918.1 OmpA family protein [candidate division KSB1 bacterium]
MPSPTDRSLEALRKILLQEDELKLKQLEQELVRLKKQIADKEALIESLDPIIADLLERKIASSKEEMAAALAPVMGDAIRHQIAEAKDDVVDALYPIIGKTIRKSVAEAMKKLVETINQRIDQALRRSLFKKRLEAKLTGVSESELVLKESLPFQIQQIFLIHKESGLLLSHVSVPNAEEKVDEELIGGMLTAIQNFVVEAFAGESKQDLNAIQYGDLNIIVEPASYFYLACVTSGIEPAQFKEDVQNLNRKIHNRFYKLLRYFDGDITKFGDIPQLLTNFIRKYGTRSLQPAKQRPSPRHLKWAWIAFAVFLIALMLALAPRMLVKQQRPIKTSTPISADISHRQREIIHQIEQQIAQRAEFGDAQFKLLVDGEQIIIEGIVPSQKIKRELGFLVSEMSEAKVILNNLEVTGSRNDADTRARSYLGQCYIFFAPNQAIIADHYQSRLDSVVAIMREVPDLRLIVKGYSDNSASHDYNLMLSKQRAQQVADYLMQRGLNRERIVVQFYGEADPIANNDTEFGRAKNRRVVFDVLSER